MIDWTRPLTRLLVGDIFHAKCPNGASLICLVEAVTDDRIMARRVTTQDNVEFDRRTGTTLGSESPCTIDSIAPLPLRYTTSCWGSVARCGCSVIPRSSSSTKRKYRPSTL
jgi:hypothetical protein